MILSNSLHKSNIIFVFREGTFITPENPLFMQLFGGESGKGVQFLEDPFMQMKVLDVPKLELQIAWERNRLRIEDLSARDPEISPLIEVALMAIEKLFPQGTPKLEGFGFNAEIYYQNSDVIRIQEIFQSAVSSPLEMGEGLMDFGWQWTKAHKNGKQLDGYFLKITAPLELVIHHNAHFKESEIPDASSLKKMFSAMYGETHEIAKSLKL